MENQMLIIYILSCVILSLSFVLVTNSRITKKVLKDNLKLELDLIAANHKADEYKRLLYEAEVKTYGMRK